MGDRFTPPKMPQMPKGMPQMPKGMPQMPKMPGSSAGLIYGAAGLIGLGYLATECLFNVEGGYKAVKFNRLTGVGRTVYNEGLNFKIPILEWPIIYDVRVRPTEKKSMTGSKDLQQVAIKIRVLTRPDQAKLRDIYCQLGPNYDQVVLPNIINEVLKSVIATYNANQIIQQREDISLQIRERITERSRNFNISIQDVSLVDIKFGQEYRFAVEQKQVAQQEAERAKFLVDKAKQNKKSTIIKAQAEAKAVELIGGALRDTPGFLELRKIDAARDIASTLSQAQNRVYLNSQSLLLNIGHDVDERVRKLTQGIAEQKELAKITK